MKFSMIICSIIAVAYVEAACRDIQEITIHVRIEIDGPPELLAALSTYLDMQNKNRS
jgi:hypothetical protein